MIVETLEKGWDVGSKTTCDFSQIEEMSVSILEGTGVSQL